MTVQKVVTFIICVCSLHACGTTDATEPSGTPVTARPSNRPFATPEWAPTANLYELNVRQYTRAGTFRAAQPALRRLKRMGVDVGVGHADLPDLGDEAQG